MPSPPSPLPPKIRCRKFDEISEECSRDHRVENTGVGDFWCFPARPVYTNDANFFANFSPGSSEMCEMCRGFSTSSTFLTNARARVAEAFRCLFSLSAERIPSRFPLDGDRGYPLSRFPFEVERFRVRNSRRRTFLIPSFLFRRLAFIGPTSLLLSSPPARRSQLVDTEGRGAGGREGGGKGRVICASDVTVLLLELFFRIPTREEADWPPYTKNHPQYFIWNAEHRSFGRGPRTTACAFWNDFLPRLKRVPGTCWKRKKEKQKKKQKKTAPFYFDWPAAD